MTVSLSEATRFFTARARQALDRSATDAPDTKALHVLLANLYVRECRRQAKASGQECRGCDLLYECGRNAIN